MNTRRDTLVVLAVMPDWWADSDIIGATVSEAVQQLMTYTLTAMTEVGATPVGDVTGELLTHQHLAEDGDGNPCYFDVLRFSATCERPVEENS